MNKLENAFAELSPSFLRHFNPERLLPLHHSLTHPHWYSLLKSLLSPSRTRLVFHGGSMVLGQDCEEDGLQKQACAYPTRFHKLLKYALSLEHGNPYRLEEKEGKGRGEKVIELINLAKGGVDSEAVLPPLPLELERLKPDALFIDFSVNDCVQASRPSKVESILMSVESMILFLKKNFPTLPLFFLETHCFEITRPIYEAKKALFDKYKVPLISYREAVGGGSHCADPAVFKVYRHPEANVHRNVAYSLMIALSLAIKAGCQEDLGFPSNEEKALARWKTASELFSKANLSNPTYSEEAREEMNIGHVCLPVMSFDSYYPEDIRKDRIRGDWSFYEDVPGKPGWIATKAGSTIEFDLMFGPHPGLYIGFLRSYTSIGSAYYTFLDGKYDLKIRLEGKHEDHTSVTYVYFNSVFRVTPRAPSFIMGMDSSHAFGIEPNSSATLRITSESDEKFKILFIIAC